MVPALIIVDSSSSCVWDYGRRLSCPATGYRQVCSTRPIPGTGRHEVVALKRQVAACGKLRRTSMEPSGIARTAPMPLDKYVPLNTFSSPRDAKCPVFQSRRHSAYFCYHHNCRTELRLRYGCARSGSRQGAANQEPGRCDEPRTRNKPSLPHDFSDAVKSTRYSPIAEISPHTWTTVRAMSGLEALSDTQQECTARHRAGVFRPAEPLVEPTRGHS
jgi:hypothetical protein